jgi:hypothetical protein
MLPDEADTQPDSAGPVPTRSRERRGPFCLQGRRTDGLPDGGPQEEGEAGQVLGGAELGPFQLYAEAAALGIPELLLQTHAPVIQGHRVREGVGQTRVPPALGPRPREPGRPCPAGGRPPARGGEASGARAGPRGFLGDPANDERRLPLRQKL